MLDDRLATSLAALRRKLRALAAVAADRGATPAERANAAALKSRVQQRLRQAGAPEGDWTDHAFRLGRWARGVGKPTAGGSGEKDWTDQVRRLGKAFGRASRKWFSD
jgi:hypothetical protein